MPTFEYTALDVAGRRTAGVLAGPSEQAVLAELESRQLTPVAILPQQEARVRRRGVSARRLGTSYIQLSELLHAGVPLLRSLRVLANRKSEKKLSPVFRELGEAVSEGEDFAAAMSRRRDVFPQVHVAMVRAGEKGGFLEAVLSRLGQMVIAQAELRGKIIGNMVYPAILAGFGTIVLGVIFGVFIPKFRPMFDRIQGGLPTVTKFVFGVSSLVGKYGLITLAIVVVLGFVIAQAAARPGVGRVLTRWKTFMPVVGPLVRSLAAARFCRMLGTMLANGVPMLTAMHISREAAGNSILEEAISTAAEAVKSGQTLAPPLAASGLFDADVIEMIAVAESANNLDSVLLKIAETVEGRVDRLLATAVKLLEPLLLLVMAGAVVLVAAALILPMTRMSAAL